MSRSASLLPSLLVLPLMFQLGPLLEAYRDIKAGTTFRVDAWQVQLLVECMETMKKYVCHNKEQRDTWHGNPLLKTLKSAIK